MPDRIGLWATTPRSSKWHLIESEIGEDTITRCGRRLHRPNTAIVRTHDTSLALCIYCNRENP